MEIIETEKRGFNAGIIAALILMIGGMALAGYFLSIIPEHSGITFAQYVLCAMAVFVPICAGGAWLGVINRKNKAGKGHRCGSMSGIAIGVLVIAVGILLFCFSTGLILPEWKKVFLSWQMLLIVLGIMEVCNLRGVSGVILLTVGNFFIIPRVARVNPASWDIAPDFVATYWPALIIVFGIVIILSIIFRNSNPAHKHKKRHREDYSNYKAWNLEQDEDGKWRSEKYGYDANSRTTGMNAETNDKEGYVDYNLVFTGSEQVFLEPVFRGGNISVVFAGMELDLRRTTLPEGTSHLHLDAVFGGIELRLPEDWNVEVRGTSVFGGFTDKRRKGQRLDTGSILIITADCVFGGGDIS